ncbi:hypothetical protein AURDEDRAFT_129702 [Auricularia subglabra TFB-10046 SS5]|nr:hypothetical protein AURDEDRAFT_129702 [Auricularia subglabra TFB-10046 SS5]
MHADRRFYRRAPPARRPAPNRGFSRSRSPPHRTSNNSSRDKGVVVIDCPISRCGTRLYPSRADDGTIEYRCFVSKHGLIAIEVDGQVELVARTLLAPKRRIVPRRPRCKRYPCRKALNSGCARKYCRTHCLQRTTNCGERKHDERRNIELLDDDSDEEEVTQSEYDGFFSEEDARPAPRVKRAAARHRAPSRPHQFYSRHRQPSPRGRSPRCRQPSPRGRSPRRRQPSLPESAAHGYRQSSARDSPPRWRRQSSPRHTHHELPGRRRERSPRRRDPSPYRASPSLGPPPSPRAVKPEPDADVSGLVTVHLHFVDRAFSVEAAVVTNRGGIMLDEQSHQVQELLHPHEVDRDTLECMDDEGYWIRDDGTTPFYVKNGLLRCRASTLEGIDRFPLPYYADMTERMRQFEAFTQGFGDTGMSAGDAFECLFEFPPRPADLHALRACQRFITKSPKKLRDIFAAAGKGNMDCLRARLSRTSPGEPARMGRFEPGGRRGDSDPAVTCSPVG